MGDEIRLDEVSIFGDKLRFLVPHEWIEKEESGDHYLFQTPDATSGWFRVSLITVKTVEPAAERLKDSVGKAASLDANSGNYVESWEKDSIEDGVPIHIFYWAVSNAVPPNVVRKAVFSYTVLTEYLEDSETQATVELLRELVSRAEFS